MKHYYQISVLYLWSFFIWSSNALAGNELPRIIHYDELNNPATKQVWAIGQTNDNTIYFGTSGGLLEFDGVNWEVYQLPNQQTIRSLKTHQDKIYTGGFEEFGYWDLDPERGMTYHSLCDQVPKDLIQGEAFWHIIVDQQILYFQSFSVLLKVTSDTIVSVQLPGNIKFAKKVGPNLVIPVINQGLFQLKSDGTPSFIEGSELLQDKNIEFLVPLSNTDFLIGTKEAGIFQYQNGEFASWDNPLNETFKKYQLNKGVRFENGHLAFGTVLNGVYITDHTGHLIHHLNQQNGLQNNTVLSLWVAQNQSLWVGLDKGIDLLAINDPILFHRDNIGLLGTVYSGVVYQNSLYLGTNHGLFQKNLSTSNQSFQIIEGTQGQVWSLKVMEDQLICGHNRGTFKIDQQIATKISDINGGWNILKIPGSSHYVQGTYTGLALYEHASDGTLKFKQRINGFTRSSKSTTFDPEGYLWVAHPNRGLFKILLSNDFTTIQQIVEYGLEDGLPSIFNLEILLWKKWVLVRSDGQYYYFNIHSQKFELFSQIQDPEFPATSGVIKKINDKTFFEILSDQVIWYHDDQKKSLDIILNQDLDRIIDLDDQYFLLCMMNGFGLLRKQHFSKLGSDRPPPTFLHKVRSSKQQLYPLDSTISITISPYEKELTFFYSTPAFGRSILFSTFLEGFSDQWSEYRETPYQTFTNLKTGKYTFKVRSNINPNYVAQIQLYKAPRWYETKLATFLFILSAIGVLWLLYRWHRSRLFQQRIRLQSLKEKQLQQERIKIRNEQLQTELNNKSKDLVNSTANLVKKNELLLDLKKQLMQLKSFQATSSSSGEFRKVLQLIDQNITSDEDWQLFESNFEAVHESFLKRLKETFPELTPGDLRLAAYLKMNLTTKEIAPLLNISIRGVENKRYRLRKKLGLAGEENLIEFMIQF